MTLTTPIRKLMLTAHITSSVGWIGALGVFFVHALVSLMSQDEQVIRSVSFAMAVSAWFVILPLSLTSLVSGLVQSVGTAWGLLRHYWIVFKLLLTAIATGVLLLKLGPISYLAEAAAESTFTTSDLTGLRTSLAVHAAGGLLVLLAAVVLAVYKPAGLTRMAGAEQGLVGAQFGEALIARVPRWVKLFGTVVVVLMLLIGLMIVGGGHGPGAHLPTT